MKPLIHRLLLTVVSILSLSAFLSCTEKEIKTETSGGRPIVYVPVPPYEFIFGRIAGDLIDLRTIVSRGDDPHSYSPTPKQVEEMFKANLICTGELGFEANYFVKIGDGSDGPREMHLLEGLELLEGHCDHPSHETETTEDDHDHIHEELNDPHVWLSPALLAKQAERIANRLKMLLPPGDASTIDANLTTFKEELTALHEELTADLAPHKGLEFYVYHGAFAYFAQDYGLEQIAIEIGNRSPTPKKLADIARKAKAEDVRLIFVQPQFDQTSANALAESINGNVAPLDPLEKDVFANLRAITKAVTAEVP